MKIIEFVGYPGSGKSYVSDLAEDYFSNASNLKILSIERYRNSVLHTKLEKFFWYVGIFIRNFFRWKFIVTTSQILFEKKSFKHLKYYYDVYGSYYLIKKKKKEFDFFIVSEGFISYPTYLFSNIKNRDKRRIKCEKYLKRHYKLLKNLSCALQIYNSSEEKTIEHTSQKRNVDPSIIKKSLKPGDFHQTTDDHSKNLLWCENHNILIGKIENNYSENNSIINQLKLYLK